MTHYWSDPGEAPRSLAGYELWLQVKHDGIWRAISPLTAGGARHILRWLGDHPSCTTLRILAEKTG